MVFGVIMTEKFIPTEWVSWIKENLKNGCSADSLAGIMSSKGFNLSVAEYAVREVVAGKDQISYGPILGAQSSDFIYEAPRVPMDVNYVDTTDKRVYIGLKVERPVIITFDNFMSHEECDQLIALASSKMVASRVVNNDTGEESLDSVRTSTGTFFKLNEDEFIAKIDRRISEVMCWPAVNGEGIQVLNYQIGAEYTAHFDYFPYEVAGSKKHLATGGQRVSTLVMYLNDVEQGGETSFPDIGISAVPKKGSAVYFEYCNSKGQVDPLSLHAGNPVVKGEKWIATKWMRQHKYN